MSTRKQVALRTVDAMLPTRKDGCRSCGGRGCQWITVGFIGHQSLLQLLASGDGSASHFASVTHVVGESWPSAPAAVATAEELSESQRDK